MSTQDINSKLLVRLKDKKYRDLFIASQINKIIPFQIRALRAARNNMTQAELAEKAETKQSVISRIQRNGAANLNIKSLLKLASAFDVALVVRFEPIDGFIDWVDELSPEVMAPRLSKEIIMEIERKAMEQEVAGIAANKAEVPNTLAHTFNLIQGGGQPPDLQHILSFLSPVKNQTPAIPSGFPLRDQEQRTQLEWEKVTASQSPEFRQSLASGRR